MLCYSRDYKAEPYTKDSSTVIHRNDLKRYMTDHVCKWAQNEALPNKKFEKLFQRTVVSKMNHQTKY